MTKETSALVGFAMLLVCSSAVYVIVSIFAGGANG